MLLPHIRAALRAEEAILQEASALSGVKKGRVRLGAVGLPTRTILPAAVRRFQEQYPGIDLEAHEGFSEQIRRQVLEGDLDIGIISRFTDQQPDFEGLRLDDVVPRVPLYVCVPQEHRLYGSSLVTASDLEGEAFVTAPPGHLMRAAFERVAAAVPVRAVYYTDTSETARTMVAARVGIAILAKPTLTVGTPEQHGLEFIRLGEPWAWAAISVIRRRDEQSPPGVRALLDIVRDEAGRASEPL